MVFDLDETLIHCNDSTSVKSDVVLPIKFPTGENINVKYYYRFLLSQNILILGWNQYKALCKTNFERNVRIL